MPFAFKLPKRLAIAWRRRPPLLFLAAARAVSLRPFWSDIGNRRRCQLPTGILRRLSDQYPCWEFFVARVVLRFAILAIPKVAA